MKLKSSAAKSIAKNNQLVCLGGEAICDRGVIDGFVLVRTTNIRVTIRFSTVIGVIKVHRGKKGLDTRHPVSNDWPVSAIFRWRKHVCLLVGVTRLNDVLHNVCLDK